MNGIPYNSAKTCRVMGYIEANVILVGFSRFRIRFKRKLAQSTSASALYGPITTTHDHHKDLMPTVMNTRLILADRDRRI